MNGFRIGRTSITLLFIVGLIFSYFAGYAYGAPGDNLVSNSGFETTDSAGNPAGWIKGRWGTNTTQFVYPVSGLSGSKAAKIIMTARTSGDAKWAFTEVTVTPGKEYEFSDFYISNVPTLITVQFRKTDGTFLYKDLATASARTSFTKTTHRFVVPSGVTKATVFHLINQVGELTVDGYSLVELTSTPPPSNVGLVPNYSLEETNSSGQPTSWGTNKWGTNTANFIYPVAGFNSNKAARVDLTTRSSGDAKWTHTPISTAAGRAYQYTDNYRSNVTTFVTVQFRLSDGSFVYRDIGSPGPSSGWGRFTMPFQAPQGAVSFTVFHVINRVGFLELDNVVIEQVTNDPTKFSQGLVSIHFDDGWRSAYENALPILNTAGFKSTQFIVTNRMNSDFPGYIRPNEVLAMQSQGHEIGAHTRTHRDLTAMTLAEARTEIEGSRQDLLEIGATPVNFFAYPFGAYNDQVKQAVKDAGFRAARSSDGGQNFRNQDKFALRRIPMTNATTLAQVQAQVDRAIADKSWVILLFHEVDNSGREYSVTPQLFQQIVNYIKSKNITPVTMSQGVGQML